MRPAFITLLLALSISAQSLTGRVFNENLSPVAGARVIAMQGEETWTVTADETGRYSLSLPRYGRYVLTAISADSVFPYQRYRLSRPVVPCDREFCYPIDQTPVNFVGRAR